MLYGVGKRIKQLREERDLSMDMLVADMNLRYNPEKPINKSMVSRWEKDKNNPSLDNIKYLSDYFDVSIDYLIGNTDIRTAARLMAYAQKIKAKKEGNNAKG